MLTPVNVLVIGSGGREHAICWKLAKSEKIKTVFVAPGNAGMAVEDKVRVVADLDVNNHKLVADWCKVNCVNLVVVGPEDHLARGIKDYLSEKKIHCFGPSKRAAQIESDKEWSKNFMDKHAVPTARWGSFTTATEAKAYINSATFPALVVKASGLAAGKGVVVASTREEACQAVDSILTDRKFGNAGTTVVVEELLEGEEVSVLAFTDGRTVELMPPSQDHKRHLDGDRGPNTGGMGAYCPCPLISGEQLRAVGRNVMQRTVDGMRADDTMFQGVLYAGLMLTKSGPKVLEFNCRFGDPETQVILPLLENDLYDVMMACVETRLERTKCLWKDDVSAVGVIMASKGYPESSSKGNVITGLDVVGKLERHLVFHSGTAVQEGHVVTNGGRVLISVSLNADLALASAAATQACGRIQFEGAQYRRDIAHRGIARAILEKGQLTYRAAGVDISAGDSLVDRIKPTAGLTGRKGVLGSIGGFGGVFDTRAAGYKDPLLVSGTDGVGTKLKIAQVCGLHSTIGIDLVAMCVNDILAHGAEPLFFLDYFACGQLDVGVAGEVVAGVAEGCKQAGCALIGGETAEMPGLYSGGDYDLAGFAVGAVERGELLPLKDSIAPGDVVVGLPSSGVHSNGFSLVRKVLQRCGARYGDQAAFGSGTYGEELLTPTRIYVKGVLPALRGGRTKAFAHITGGGLTENIPRVLPPDLGVILDAALWDIPPVFPWLAATGGVNEAEMLRTFNCGVGAVLVVAPEHKEEVLAQVAGERPVVIGSVRKLVQGERRVEVQNFVAVMEAAMRPFVAPMVGLLTPHKKRVAVLISGSGTNLQSLIDATLDPEGSTGAEIILVVSNKPNVEGLKRAERANIPTKVISHTAYKSRLEFDMAVHGELTSRGAELVCLAGFMRVLTGEFVRLWRGRLVNIHPALLPLFKGTHAHRQALAAGVRVTGCTAHFVEEDVDAGAILAQEAVPIELGDTEESLQERVKLAEHRVFPRALALVASGTASLDADGKLVWRH